MHEYVIQSKYSLDDIKSGKVANKDFIHKAYCNDKPHGRLIDADAHREEFMEFVYAELQDDADNHRANRTIDFFDTLPTALEASE